MCMKDRNTRTCVCVCVCVCVYWDSSGSSRQGDPFAVRGPEERKQRPKHRKDSVRVHVCVTLCVCVCVHGRLRVSEWCVCVCCRVRE